MTERVLRECDCPSFVEQCVHWDDFILVLTFDDARVGHICGRIATQKWVTSRVSRWLTCRHEDCPAIVAPWEGQSFRCFDDGDEAVMAFRDEETALLRGDA